MIEWISLHIPAWVWIAIIVHGAVLGTVAYLILLERKVASWVQDRIGPNRVGLGFGIIPGLKDMKMWGLGQPLADGLKFVLKEDYMPKGVDAVLFTIAPCIMMAVIIISIAVIPWGGVKQSSKTVELSQKESFLTDVRAEDLALQHVPAGALAVGDVKIDRPANDPQHNANATITYRWDFQIANLNIGVLYVVATLSLAVYGVVIGGWASNNKFSFLGGLRATANMISYEIPMGLSILCIVLMFGTLDLGELVSKQAHYWIGFIPAWNVFTQPLAFLLFLICIHAEANRAPFDLAECEQELVGGYHTEYSSMRFALFFLAEYAGMITTSCVCVALFFGGWHFPGLGGDVDPNNPAISSSFVICILRAIVFFVKVIAIIFIFMWVRWSLPRFRFDQLMDIAWRALIPMSLALTVGTAIMVRVTGGETFPAARARHAFVFLIMNLFVLGMTIFLSRWLPKPPPTNRRLKVTGSRFSPMSPATSN